MPDQFSVVAATCQPQKWRKNLPTYDARHVVLSQAVIFWSIAGQRKGVRRKLQATMRAGLAGQLEGAIGVTKPTLEKQTPPPDLDLSLMQDVFARYSDQQGALIPILQQAQAVYGYLPRVVLQLIANHLSVSLGKVYGVATFYAQFYLERRGRHVLRLCDGTACHVKGTPLLLTAVKDELDVAAGETTEDGQLTVEIVYCLGSCALAPVAVLDDQVMGRMRQEVLLQNVKKAIG